MLLESRLKKIRIEQQDKLNSKNLYLYKSITIYIKNSNLRRLEKEEILQQIMDMMLQAQNENRPISVIIGDDYEEFCQSIIKEYETNKSKSYRILSYIQRYLSTLFIVSLLMWIIGGDLSNYFIDFKITVDNFIVANLVSIIIVPASKKGNQKTSSMSSYAPLWEKLSITIRGKNLFTPTLIMLAILIFKQSILKEIVDPKFFTQSISIGVLAALGISIISIASLIEVYKRVYDKETIGQI